MTFMNQGVIRTPIHRRPWLEIHRFHLQRQMIYRQLANMFIANLLEAAYQFRDALLHTDSVTSTRIETSCGAALGLVDCVDFETKRKKFSHQPYHEFIHARRHEIRQFQSDIQIPGFDTDNSNVRGLFTHQIQDRQCIGQPHLVRRHAALKKSRNFITAQRDNGPRRLTGPDGIDHNEMIAIPDMLGQ
jgi:hypothetical protein